MFSDSLSVELIYADPPISPMPGVIWVQKGASYSFTNLPIGTYVIRIADSAGLSCNRIEVDTIRLVPTALDIELRQENYASCIGMGTVVIFNRANKGTNNRPLTVVVLDQPTGGDIPATFQWALPTVTFDQPSYNIHTRSHLPGNYSFVFIDSAGLDPSCYRYDTIMNFDMGFRYENVIEVNNECNGDLLIRRTAGAMFTSYGSYYTPTPSNYITEIRDSTGVLMETVYGVAGPDRHVNIDFSVDDAVLATWPDGTYSIRTFNAGMRGLGLPYSTDSCTAATATWTKYSGRVDPSASIFVNGCDADSADAMIIGIGRGNYKAPLDWTLYSNSISQANLVAGPQASNVFEGLRANQPYVIQATDQCGVSQNYVTSVSTTLRLFATSSTNTACPGEDVTFYVEDIPGAQYQWYKDNVALVGETSNALVLLDIDSVADHGEYTVVVNLFNECTLTSNAFDLEVDCEPLSIKLAQFTAQKTGKSVSLHWQTNQELNNKGYYIQKSKDGINWSELDFVASKSLNGTSDVALVYRYQDTKPFDGLNVYRLKQVDYNGRSSYSDIRNVHFGVSSSPISIFPNPTSDVVKITGLQGNETIIVYDIMGRALMNTHALQADIQLSLENLDDGTYRIQVQNEHATKSYPVIKISK